MLTSTPFSRRIWASALLVLLAACGNDTQTQTPTTSVTTPTIDTTPATPESSGVSNKTVTYQTSNDIFLNPERGYRVGLQLMGGDNLATMRSRGYSVLQAYVSLRAFKSGPISDAYLTQIRSRLTDVRNAGIKVSLRFWYSWSETEADAPKAVVMNHIAQLTPILKDFSDVIMVLQAGFIGAWGEWHSSLSGLDNDTDRRDVFMALTNALPKDRKIQVRYVGALRLFAPSGLTETQAFSDPVLSRLAFHNDCFMVNQSDAGTYAWSDPQRTLDRDYLQAMVKYMPVGGEMCGDVPTQGTDPYNRRTPEGQLAEFQRFGWSWIANDFGNVQIWKDWGIYDTIERNLGYRLTLTQSVVPNTLTLGKSRLTLNFSLKNVGWAAPFNPRLVRLVLRSSKQSYTFNLNIDPRKWYAGTTQTINIDEALPTNMVAGQYEVLLHLPDPYTTLTNRPEYAIRLANPNVWEATTGYNKLGQTIQVK